MLMGFLSEFCNGSRACKAGLMLLSDAPKEWWFVRLFRHNARTPETDEQTEMIQQILMRDDSSVLRYVPSNGRSPLPPGCYG